MIEINLVAKVTEVGNLLVAINGERIPGVHLEFPEEAGDEGAVLPVTPEMARKLGGRVLEDFDVKIQLTPKK